MVSRRQWVAAVKAAPFPPSQRPVKATLLSLADLMTPEGELHRWRDEMAAAAGDLPPRTLDRHLGRAVQDRWLIREVPGGNGRRSLYRGAPVEYRDGWSWTPDPVKARWFADRFTGLFDCHVWVADVEPARMLGKINTMRPGEREVVVDSDGLSIRAVR